MRPTLSVVIPAKDAAAFLPFALTSVTEQGIDPSCLEVLLVDDGSGDGTRAVARAFEPRIPGLRILGHDRTRGLSASRNTGLEAATGDHIAFLDADDWFGKGHLGHLVAARERLGVDIVRCDVIAVHGTRREVRTAPVDRRDVPLSTRDHIAHGVRGSMVDFPNAFSGVYPRRVLDDGLLTFDESLASAEDRLWNWRILLGGYTFAVVDSPGAFYRRSVATSLSAVYDASQLAFVMSCLKVYRQLVEDDEPEEFRVKAGHNLFALYNFHLEREDAIPDDLRAERERQVIAAGLEIDRGTFDAVVATFSPARARALAPVLRAIEAQRG